MDFTHRNTMGSSSAHNHPAPAQPSAPAPGTPAPSAQKPGNGRSSSTTFIFPNSRWMRAALVALLFSLTIVAVGIVGLLYLGSSKESKYIDTKGYQAVFVGQNQTPYFGHIKSITNNYIDLQDIFWLNPGQTQQGSSSSSSSNTTLVKLGCEVHGPTDQMIINRSQVVFWENLRDNGQVVTAINTWIKDNPNGLTCTAPSNSTTQAGSSNTTTNSGNSSTSNTSSTTSNSSNSSTSTKQ